ncbi:MAG: hypothetical protein ACREXY_00765, partial [Gammaproteobacteria bacterium]
HLYRHLRDTTLVASPAYGSHWAGLGEAFAASIQGKQMSYGSSFLGDLHGQWKRLIKRDPRVRADSFALVGVCAGRATDGVVPHASAAMNSSLVGIIKYIPARHSGFARCSEDPIVYAIDDQHLGYQFIRDFLLGHPLGADYKTMLSVTSGMLIIQLYDRKTGKGVRVIKLGLIDGKPRGIKNTNLSTWVVTLRELEAGKRSLLLVPPVAYQPPDTIDVEIRAGQATVKLVPVEKR